MKKRIFTFLLAIIMILSVVPATALTANAASKLATSDKAIGILKEYEGFVQYQYEFDGKYYIGYGSQIEDGKYPNGISKEDATALLKKYLADNVDTKINELTKSWNRNLTQNQHDALAMFIYNYGSLPTDLQEAVRTGKTGNEMINIWARYYGISPAGENFKGLMNRRLSEVNMFLNNRYGYYAPANYTYVVLDMDGNEKVDTGDRVIAYDYNAPLTLAVVPEVGTKVFMGWHFDDADGKAGILGDQVTKLDKNTAGKVLIANIVKKNDEADVNYTINSNSLHSRYYYSEPIAKANYKDQIDEKKRGEYRANTTLEVTKEKMVDGVKWLYVKGIRVSDGKSTRAWVYLGELPEADKVINTPIATATLTATVNIRAGATVGDGTDILGTVNKGTTVNIYEIQIEKTETGNKRWGKVIDVNGVTGWINLAYATENAYSGETDSANGKTAIVVNTDKVNVRDDATVSAKLLTELEKGTKVTILKTYSNNGKQWAYVQWTGLKDGYTKGWVYMYYLEVEGAGHSNPDGSVGSVGALQYTGVVTSNINLNVRSKPDVYAARVSSLPTGTKVNIYDVVTSRNMKWGQIGENQWVCLTYVKLTAVSGSGTGTATPSDPEVQGTVTVTSLDVLKNYNSNAAKVGSLAKGTVVTVLEKNTESTETGTRIWGRISHNGVEGWINLAYVNLKNVTTVTPGTGSSTGSTGSSTPTAAVIANCLSVNVRESAGVYSAQITRLNNGTPVTVYEQITHDKAPWARIKWNNGANEGWVCMYYVTLNAAGTNTGTTEGGLVGGTNSNTISATGYVNNVFLNVRSGAGLGYAQIGTLNKGAKVTVYEQVIADGMIWGRIAYNNASGWVSMSYITVESASSTGKGVMGTVARCFAAANVRSAPGTNNALVGKVNVGSRVEVFETRQHASQMWGRIAQGWVCMDYILLDSELPPGTALDATEPTTAPTTQPETNKPVNTNGELAFTIEASILQDLNVRNDANANSDRVGTIKAGMLVDIKAVKNNGAELWGRIDQYATAGWINMDKANVNYGFTRYVNTDEQPIYVEANASSEVKGTLGINTELDINKITTDGTNVYGWVEKGIYGWIPMSKTSDKAVDVIRTYKSGESVGNYHGNALFTGTTFNNIDAYDSIGGSRILFKMTSGVTVSIDRIKFENGRVWGYVDYADAGQDSGEYGYAWIDMSKVNYTLAGTITTELNVRSSMDNSTTKDDDPNNIVTTLASGEAVQVCQFAFDAYGNIWARLNGDYDPDPAVETNGMFVMVKASSGTVYVTTAATP